MIDIAYFLDAIPSDLCPMCNLLPWRDLFRRVITQEQEQAQEPANNSTRTVSSIRRVQGCSLGGVKCVLCELLVSTPMMWGGGEATNAKRPST